MSKNTSHNSDLNGYKDLLANDLIDWADFLYSRYNNQDTKNSNILDKGIQHDGKKQ